MQIVWTHLPIIQYPETAAVFKLIYYWFKWILKAVYAVMKGFMKAAISYMNWFPKVAA
jgi:hypothetical protein